MTKFKTRRVERSSYTNYLKRAKECLNAAQRSFNAGEWNASTISAIHSVIAASDTMSVYFLGQRHAGESHEEAVKLFSTIRLKPTEIKVNAKRISRILGIKNMAEYEERLIYRSETEKALKDAERLYQFVKSKLPG